MKQKIFALYDSKTEVYGNPILMVNTGTALRSLLEAMGDKNSTLAKYPADFTFFEIGEYDDSNAHITMHKSKINLGNLLEFTKQTNQTEWQGQTVLKDGQTFTSNSKDMQQ